jgi:hydrogenase/urease accessory protein HupE
MRVRPAVLTFALVILAAPVWAHPAPFSYLDLHLGPGGARGSLVAHAFDLAHELGLASPDAIVNDGAAESNRDRLFSLLGARWAVVVGGVPVSPVFDGLEVLRDRQAVRFRLHVPLRAEPGALTIRADLFPYDPNHQTFVNVYEGDRLTHQAILDRRRTAIEYFAGTPQGRLAVVRKFVTEGVRHIAIGPDHILFLIGLLLLGGRLVQLVRIVTAFTLAHSLTLSLAVLNVITPSARLVEPAIALSIIYVGADNLLMTKQARDVRAWIALAFGLVHGFGFAGVLKEMDLPRQALGWSLFSFNVGVEIGQVCFVVAIALGLAAARRWSEALGRRLAFAGSILVIAAGAYWFVERVFLTGGAS